MFHQLLASNGLPWAGLQISGGAWSPSLAIGPAWIEQSGNSGTSPSLAVTMLAT